MQSTNIHTLEVSYSSISETWYALVAGIDGLVGEGATKQEAILEAINMYDYWCYSGLFTDTQEPSCEVVFESCDCEEGDDCDNCLFEISSDEI